MVATHRVSATERRQMVAEAAYFLAEHRGFDDGDPVADWLQAEAEVDARLGEAQRLRERLEERLAAVDRKLKSTRRKLAAMTADVREEWEDDIDRLAKLRDLFRARLSELRSQGAEVSDRARQQLEKGWKEANELLQRLEERAKKQRKR